MRLCASVGFCHMDINLHAASLPNGPLARDDWEEWVEGIAKLKKELGTHFFQGHSHFYTWPAKTAEEFSWHEKMMRRSIAAVGRLGVAWLVLHPFSLEDQAWYSHKKSLAYNVQSMRRYEETASSYPGLGLAIENMVENRDKRRFGSSAEDLIELYEALGSKRFGLCWDFGHAERSNIDHAASLRQMGKLLKATHIEDTNELYFGCDHLLPYVGIVDWDSVMPVFAEIGYEGDITFEIHNFTRRMPPELREAALRFSFAVGEHLLKLAENGNKR